MESSARRGRLSLLARIAGMAVIAGAAAFLIVTILSTYRPPAERFVVSASYAETLSGGLVADARSSAGYTDSAEEHSEPPEPAQPQIRTVYVTKSGKKYHAINPCGSGEYAPCTLEEALRRGLEPCAKCIKMP